MDDDSPDSRDTKPEMAADLEAITIIAIVEVIQSDPERRWWREELFAAISSSGLPLEVTYGVFEQALAELTRRNMLKCRMAISG